MSTKPSLDILTRTRNKLAVCRCRLSLTENILFFGHAEWQEFADYAEHNWMVRIQPHTNNYLASTRILKCELPRGIYTSEELAKAIAYQAAKDGEEVAGDFPAQDN